MFIQSHAVYMYHREGNRKCEKKERKKKRWFLTIDDCSSDREGKKTNRQGNTESVARKPPLRSVDPILTSLPPSIQLSLSIFRYKRS